MAGLTPLPPYVLHSSTRLTHAEAHADLFEFLENAENNAAYRPDSTLSESGPQSVSTGANPNFTLHHLRRILQGIEGKRIGGEDVGRFFGEGARVSNEARKRKAEEEEQQDGRRYKQFDDVNGDNEGIGPGVAIEEEQDGWQDKDEYDQAQDDDEVNLMGEDRHPGAHLEEPANSQEAEDMAAIVIEDTGEKVGLSQQSGKKKKSKNDKEARKAAKRDRLKVAKRVKEDAKATR